jgi:hypothetical protein
LKELNKEFRIVFFHLEKAKFFIDSVASLHRFLALRKPPAYCWGRSKAKAQV